MGAYCIRMSWRDPFRRLTLTTPYNAFGAGDPISHVGGNSAAHFHDTEGSAV